MQDAIIAFLDARGIPSRGIVFIISMAPVFELRLGLIAASALRIPVTESFWICLLGNLLPIPFILLFIKAIFAFCKKRALFPRVIEKLESIAARKSETVKKRLFWGLFLFVAIPLPGTGGWTGALIASMLEMDIKKSFAAIALGVFAAGLIMITLAYFIPGYFGSNLR
jgi:uncharacterized membrane protein